MRHVGRWQAGKGACVGGMVDVAHGQPSRQSSPSSCLGAETPGSQRRKQAPPPTTQGVNHDHSKSVENPSLFARDWSWGGRSSGQ